ncbi:MAG: SDR family oxidoreductase [Candidatus Heimdallarchaeota archaeon]|nr:SDR family oxidoreductase [Candidatus Heimdallarchaeota archaeon]
MMNEKILVVGATGYIGSRLVLVLLQRGYQVRVTYRDIKKLKNKIWYEHHNLEMVYADVYNQLTIIKACENITVVYYLVHSMNPDKKDFAKWDRIATRNIGIATLKNSVRRIIYLGGLTTKSKDVSKHLRSRTQVGKLLQGGKVPTTVLQAAMIIGSGSVSFEMLRYLVDRLPIMITPKWVNTLNQPIAISNVIEYLVGCLRNEKTTGKTFDIGGPDVLNYKQLINIYAQEARLMKRMIITLPINDPRKSSAYFISRLIPIDSSVIHPLIESLRNEVICEDNDISNFVPEILISAKEAIRRAVAESKQAILHNSLQLAGWVPPIEWSQLGDPEWSGGSQFYDRRAAVVKGDIDELWSAIESIGGTNGWYHGNTLWKIRGKIDQIVGGPGIRRGRKHPTLLKQRDILDCWRVRRIIKNRELLLSAEMKLPGHATLNFKIQPVDENTSIIEQIAYFVPHGLWGFLYWQFIIPFHTYIFHGMIKGIVKEANNKIIYGPKFLKKNVII